MKTFLAIGFIAAIGSWFGMTSVEQVPDITKGKVVVQLNYEWNKSNNYQWKPTTGITYFYLSLDKFPELKAKMKIKTVPTIIVLNNGIESKRIDGGLMMRIEKAQAEIIK
jgi:hypothetical protein